MKEESDDLKRSILKAAIKSYGKKGIAATTITDIAKLCNISASQIAYHFGSIKHVFPEVVSFVSETARDFTNAHIDRRGRDETVLEAYVQGTLKWGAELPEHRAIWIYVVYMASFDEATRTQLGQFFAIAQARIESALYEYSAKRSLPLLNDDKMIAKIHSLLVGEISYQAVFQREKAWREQSKEFLRVIDGLLNSSGLSK